MPQFDLTKGDRRPGSNVGIPQGGIPPVDPAGLGINGREHWRGPKAPDVVPRRPTRFDFIGELGFGERNEGGSVKVVQRRARTRALRWTLHGVYGRREHRRGPKAPDVVPGRPTHLISAGTIIAPIRFWVLWSGSAFGVLGSRQGAAGSVPAGARPASSHRRAAPSPREGAGRRGDGIRRGFRPSASFFSLFWVWFWRQAVELGQ